MSPAQAVVGIVRGRRPVLGVKTDEDLGLEPVARETPAREQLQILVRAGHLGIVERTRRVAVAPARDHGFEGETLALEPVRRPH